MLLERLPPESTLNTAIRNSAGERQLNTVPIEPANAPWSSVEMLVAQLIDEIRAVHWAYTQAHTDKKIPRPSPFPRPGVDGRSGIRRMKLSDMRQIDPRLRNLSDEEAIAKLRELTGRA